MSRRIYGEERDPTPAEVQRWDEEEAREFGFNGYDEPDDD